MDYTVRENLPLAPLCSMRTGGPAKRALFPRDAEGLCRAVTDSAASGEKYIIVGNCSNLLFPDEGFDGAVIFTTGVKGLSCEDGVITAACGETLNSLSRFALKNSLTGLEFCHGIPGTIGGGVYMNAGAYGGEIAQTITECTVLDASLEKKTVPVTEKDFGYRRSFVSDGGLILLSAAFRASVGDRAEIDAKMKDLMSRRKKSQPLEFPSCGSAFKRPAGHYAGALIEQCGLKGVSVGGAQVSEKHAGFIINKGGATSSDVVGLISLVRGRVFDQTGVTLEPEIKLIGTD